MEIEEHTGCIYHHVDLNKQKEAMVVYGHFSDLEVCDEHLS